jgi:hypothetical protein
MHCETSPWSAAGFAGRRPGTGLRRFARELIRSRFKLIVKVC